MPHALRSMHAREEGIGSRVYQASGGGGGSNGGPVGPACSLPTIQCSTFFNVYVLHFSDLELSCCYSTNVWLLQLPLSPLCIARLHYREVDCPSTFISVTLIILQLHCREVDCISVNYLRNCNRYPVGTAWLLLLELQYNNFLQCA